MRTVRIGSAVLGEGRPRICVPVAAADREELIRQAKAAAACPAADLAEWRADGQKELCLAAERACPETAVSELMRLLRENLGGLPVLFTFRSRREGGEAELEDAEYEALIKAALDAGADAVDIELSRGEKLVGELIRAAKERGAAALVSSHDFEKTPPTEEMTARLLLMDDLGADLCKLAVMPQTPPDTLRLLEATWRARQERPQILAVTMAMARTGAVSRICGELFGSVMTFGTAGKASAPGQMDAVHLRQALELLS